MGAYEWFRAGVALAPTPLSDTGLPGVAVAYDLTLTNEGNVAGWFVLDVVDSSLGWAVAVDAAPVWLAAGASAQIEVVVTIPADALAGALNVATVRATAQHDTAVIAVAEIRTTAEQVAALTFAPNRTSGGFPGSVIVHAHTLINEGNGADTFTLAAASSEGWLVTVYPAAVTLDAGESATVLVSVTIPALSDVEVTDVTTVTATSTYDSAVNAVVTDTTVGYPQAQLYNLIYLPLVMNN